MADDTQELLALILSPAPGGLPERRAQPPPHERARKFSQFDGWLRELARFLPAPSDPELDGYLHTALMGVVVGFGDRNLSPYLAEHTAILPPLLEDVRTVYRQVQDSGADYSPEEFTFRAFDYGIHKAYYLDWRLYLSKDLY